MRPLLRRPILALVALLHAVPAAAVLVASGDGTGNTSAPSDDPGWAHVGTTGLTAIYLGNGWVLTAHHAGAGDATFQGVTHRSVPGSGVRLAAGAADLLLFRIESDPGLASLALAAAAPSAGQEVLLIGWGRNRGEPISFDPGPGPPRPGWAWGDGRSMRWGTNRVEQTSFDLVLGGSTTRSFSTEFDAASGTATGHEAQAVVGDSGGAVFARQGPGSSWELAGVMLALEIFDGQPGATSIQGNRTWAAQLPFYRSQILAVSAVPACSNGVDDDGDGLTDHPDDLGCLGPADAFERQDFLVCDDGFDADADGLVDHPGDPGCGSPLGAVEDPACDDGLDDDADGLVDWDGGGAGDPDPECVGRPWRGSERPGRCGLGFEVALLLVTWAARAQVSGRLAPSATTSVASIWSRPACPK